MTQMTSMLNRHASHIVEVVEGGLQPAGLAPHVTRSWSRCLRDFGIEPTARRSNVVLSAPSVKESQQHLGSLLAVAQAEMESLYEQNAGLCLGALWDERHEGTNGIGTCLAEGNSVTVHREEHYFGYNVPLSCSAAPILDPQGVLVGVLDSSTAKSSDSRLIQRHTMALVNMSANLISRWNFLNDFTQAWVLRFHSRPEFVGLLHEALIAIDGGGKILAVNESAMLQLGCSSRAALVGSCIEKVFQFDFATLDRRASVDPAAIWPVRDLAHGRRFFAIVRPPARRPIQSFELSAASRLDGRAALVQRSRSERHVGEDPQIRENLDRGIQLFARQVPILLQGATGTGKEAFAKALHRSSPWSEKPFVTVNCAAIPESLIESELFGYTRGAFTGAAKEGRIGKILQSNGGTLFLDEIGDMPLMLQTRLLRVLEEREIVPLGSEHTIPVDLHVISATHRDVRLMIENGEFREDLFYRLNGITLHLPLLRDRIDKPALIESLLLEENPGTETVEIADDAFAKLLKFSWPGNIRQLRNALRTASALCRDGVIRVANLPQEILGTDTRPGADGRGSASFAEDGRASAAPPGTPASSCDALREAEHAALLRELAKTHWNISRTARALGISRNTLYRKMHKHGIVLAGVELGR